MSRLKINGGWVLDGAIEVLGSKNAALPLLAASLLTSEAITLHNIPPILDVARMLTILQSLGVAVEQRALTVKLQARDITTQHISVEIIGLLRGSILLLGALLGRNGQVELPRPGGDIIGQRPINTHLDVFRQLGVRIVAEGAVVKIDGAKMRAGEVVLREFSVTATENALLTAATLPGVTRLYCAATEPHVVALAELLNQMGAAISGMGTHTLTIQGSEKLRGTSFTNIPDMLEAGFFILMGAITRSELEVREVPLADLRLFLKKLDDIGIKYEADQARQIIRTKKSGEFKAFTMQSLPHPGIATDLQSPFSVVATQAVGNSLIHDPMYEGRLKHIFELQKMGAQAVICDPHRVIVTGPTPLTGRTIPSLDIRSGATLVMAGLVAQGETIIEGAEIIERGYWQLPERLKAISANIERLEE